MKSKLTYYILIILFCASNLSWDSYGGYYGYQLKINIPSRILELYYNGQFIREYPVAVGKSRQFMTPLGSHFITKKVTNPIWENPFKDYGKERIAENNNPLGKYWMEFATKDTSAFGIHGNNSPNSIGKFVSHGCVRMYNNDIEELFNLIPEKTPLYITYDRLELILNNEIVYMRVHPDPYNMGSITITDVQRELKRIKLAKHNYIQVNKSQVLAALNQKGQSNDLFIIGEIK